MQLMTHKITGTPFITQNFIKFICVRCERERERERNEADDQSLFVCFHAIAQLRRYLTSTWLGIETRRRAKKNLWWFVQLRTQQQQSTTELIGTRLATRTRGPAHARRLICPQVWIQCSRKMEPGTAWRLEQLQQHWATWYRGCTAHTCWAIWNPVGISWDLSWLRPNECTNIDRLGRACSWFLLRGAHVLKVFRSRSQQSLACQISFRALWFV